MDNSGWDEESCIWSGQFDGFSEEILVAGRVEMMNRALVSSSMDLQLLHGEGSIETADSILPNLVTEAAIRGAAPPSHNQLSSIPPPCISSVDSDSSWRPERPLKQRPGLKRKRGEDSGSLLNCSSSSAAYGGFQISFSKKERLGGSGYEPDAEGVVQVKEMIYRAAALRPVSSAAEAAVEKPRRKNVRISSDPQTVAARQRRERISERLRVLQRLVPGGSKMDTASMLDEAASYLKFLKAQVSSLEKLGGRSTAGRSTMISTVGAVTFREEADHPPCANPKAWRTVGDQPDDGSCWFRV